MMPDFNETPHWPAVPLPGSFAFEPEQAPAALPRFLATFEVFAGDQMTGVSSPALAQAMTASGWPRPEAVRARLMPVFAAAHRWRRAAERTFVTYDAGLMMCAVMAGSLLLRLAEADVNLPPRNPAADAIAARFAAAAPGDEGLGDIEQRLDFAPRYRLVAAQTALAVPEGNAARGESGERLLLPFAGQGAILIHGLPADARLSAGAKADGNVWALAPGDLDNLEVTLPGGGALRLEARIDVVSPVGARLGRFAVRLVPAPRRSPAPLAAAGRQDRDDTVLQMVPTLKFGRGASDIRTGAVTPANPAEAIAVPKPRPAVKAPVIERVRAKKPKPARRAVRRTAKAQAASKVAPVLAETPPPALTFKPAAESSAASKETSGAGKQFLINLGVFPSSPMESEAARR